MEHHDSLGNGVGGGEILEFWGKGLSTPDNPYLNNSLIQQYNLMPLVIAIIIGILIVIMVRVLMNINNVRSLKKGKGILSELDFMDSVRRRDAAILRYNKLIHRLTNIVERSAFRSNKANKEYVEYNLERAEVFIPGKARYMKAEEFNGVVVGIAAAVFCVDVLVMLMANIPLGIVMMLLTVMMATILPMSYLRQVVKFKDGEIKSNFADFYLMIHYVLIAGSKTPLTSTIKSYAKTTDSEEMKHMADVCIHYMDTYGELEATNYISRAYREIPVMQKLMRLIRQTNQGADVKAELMGFRQELLNAKRYDLEKRTDKLINKARASFNLLMPILVQAILSAMSIYLSDMGLIKTFVS